MTQERNGRAGTKSKSLELSLKHMKEAQDAVLAAHEKNLEEMERVVKEMKEKTELEAKAWLKDHMEKLLHKPTEEEGRGGKAEENHRTQRTTKATDRGGT